MNDISVFFDSAFILSSIYNNIIIEPTKCTLIVFTCSTLLHISPAAIFKETSLIMAVAETCRRVLHIKTIFNISRFVSFTILCNFYILFAYKPLWDDDKSTVHHYVYIFLCVEETLEHDI